MRVTHLSCALLLIACGGGDKAPAVDSAAAVMPAPTVNLAELSGKWSMVQMAEGSDSVVVTAEMNATGSSDGWTLTLPGRPPMPMRISVSGDSIMVETGPYESVLRKGVQVTTNGVMRLVDGKLVGTTVAHYAGVTTADSVLRMRSVNTRMP